MNNEEVKKIIRQSRIMQYEIAERLGVSEYTLCKWFRRELTDEQKQRIFEAVRAIKSEGNAYE